jgi:16S rRNA processing protein RimM
LKSSSSTVDIGFVVRAHGVRGVVRIRSAFDALATAKTIWLDDDQYTVRHASRDKAEWLVTLEEVTGKDAADALRGRHVRVARELVPIAEDELLVADLVGCTLVDVAGTVLGEVTGSFDSGAHEVLEVRSPAGTEFMVPMVDAIVVAVDLEARRITCDPPEGLVDLEKAT